MPNRRYNTQVANPMKTGGRVKKWAVECLLLEKIWLQDTTKTIWV